MEKVKREIPIPLNDQNWRLRLYSLLEDRM